MKRRFVIHYRALVNGRWTRWYYERKTQRINPYEERAFDAMRLDQGDIIKLGRNNVEIRVRERKDSPARVS